MSTPIEEIDGGDYELVSEIFDQPQPAEYPGAPFTFKRYRKGDLVTLDRAEAQRLYKGGAVVLPGERELAAATVARMQYEAALAALPESVRTQVLAEIASTAQVPAESEDDEPAAPGAAKKPRRVAPLEDWVAYAVSQGADRTAVESATKEELIGRFGA